MIAQETHSDFDGVPGGGTTFKSTYKAIICFDVRGFDCAEVKILRKCMHSLVNERVCPNQKNRLFLVDVRSVIRSAARPGFPFR